MSYGTCAGDHTIRPQNLPQTPSFCTAQQALDNATELRDFATGYRSPHASVAEWTAKANIYKYPSRLARLRCSQPTPPNSNKSPYGMCNQPAWGKLQTVLKREPIISNLSLAVPLSCSLQGHINCTLLRTASADGLFSCAAKPPFNVFWLLTS